MSKSDAGKGDGLQRINYSNYWGNKEFWEGIKKNKENDKKDQ